MKREREREWNGGRPAQLGPKGSRAKGKKKGVRGTCCHEWNRLRRAPPHGAWDAERREPGQPNGARVAEKRRSLGRHLAQLGCCSQAPLKLSPEPERGPNGLEVSRHGIDQAPRTLTHGGGPWWWSTVDDDGLELVVEVIKTKRLMTDGRSFCG